MRAQIDGVLRVPEKGVTLKQLAAKAAVAEQLQQQLDSLAARNEVLRRDVAAAEARGGFSAGARQRLQALAAAFGVRQWHAWSRGAVPRATPPLCVHSGA